MKPRTLWGCHSVAAISSCSVAPPGRFSRSRTLDVLLPWRALDAGFACLAPLGALWPFLAGVVFFPALPFTGAIRGLCAGTLAFLDGLGSSGTEAVTFVSAMLSVLILFRSPFAAAA